MAEYGVLVNRDRMQADHISDDTLIYQWQIRTTLAFERNHVMYLQYHSIFSCENKVSNDVVDGGDYQIACEEKERHTMYHHHNKIIYMQLTFPRQTVDTPSLYETPTINSWH